MKLWLLQPREDLGPENPWEPWYDKAFGFVVRAATESEARALAQSNAGAERYDSFFNDRVEPWLDAAFSTCVALTAKGEPGVIVRDFRSA